MGPLQKVENGHFSYGWVTFSKNPCIFKYIKPSQIYVQNRKKNSFID